MNKRQNHIINLLRNNNWMTGKNLSTLLKVSDRTIRSDIKKINEISKKEIIESNIKFGYRLKQNVSLDFNKEYSSSKRRMEILKRFISLNNKIKLYDLVDQLHVSDSSIINDVDKINVLLSNYEGLKIRKKNDNFELIGDESSVRKLYKDLLLEETKNNLFNINKIASLYNKFDLINSKNILESVLAKYNYEVRDIDFPILLIHIGVTLDRIIDKKYIKNIKVPGKINKTIEYKIAYEFFMSVEERLGIKIDESEVFLLSKILLSKNINYRFEPSYENLKIKVLIKDLLKNIYEQFGINFISDQELVNGLCIHIEALCQRQKNNVPATNLYLNEIKKRYPYIFELAVFTCDYLNNKLNINIGEEEIGFIGLHLGTSYEKTYKKKYRLLLIAPDSSMISENLSKQIINNFGEKLELISTLSYFEENKIKPMNLDLIITSIPIYHSLPIPTVYISIFYKDTDQSNILKAIRDLDLRKLKLDYGLHLKTILNSDNFYYGFEFNNKYEAIKFLCNRLYDKKYVSKNYYKNVLERELMSSTSFMQGFAIPHSLTTEDVFQSTISILVLNKPIDWNGYLVQIIFLLTIKDTNSPILKLFFNWMETIADDSNNFSKLLTCSNFEKFIEEFSKGT